MKVRTISGLAGFLALGLSPSFMDWREQKKPEGRVLIVAYYAVTLVLLWHGVLRS